MSTRATIASADGEGTHIHIYNDMLDTDPEDVWVAIHGPFEASSGDAAGGSAVSVCTKRNILAEACTEYLKRHAEYLAWKATQAKS